MMKTQMTSAEQALAFIFAGNATFTLRSQVSGSHFTYRVQLADKRQPTDPDTYFVKVLAGPDNTNDYVYAGMIKNKQFRLTNASKVKMDAPSIKALVWALAKFQAKTVPTQLEFWHEGRCGRCGRPLTVPESIATGIGPDCAAQMGIAQVTLPKEEKKQTEPKAPKAQPEAKTDAAPEATEVVKRMVSWYAANEAESYTMDGEMSPEEAKRFWTRRFSSQPLEDDRFWGDEFGRHEAEQEAKAFMSDPDFRRIA